MQSALRFEPAPGLHVAVIMDGNGRWGLAHGASRLEGHRAGAAALRRVVEAAPALGIGTLTVYAFSADNWKRPEAEVSGLMQLFGAYLQREAARCARDGVRLSVIGRRDRLGAGLVQAIARAEARTSAGRRLHLRVALDYSARQAIAQGPHFVPGPDVDLLIRTGGEQRLSDFLLYECAYAELVFVDRWWPEFGPAELEAAVADFKRRDRRFGGLSAVSAPTPVFQAPAGLAIDPSGAMVVADALSGRLWRLGGVPKVVAEGLERPETVRADGQGALYVLERSPWRSRVRRIGPDGARTPVFTARPDQHLGDLAVAPDGTVYLVVWDAEGRRLIRLAAGNQDMVGRFEGAPGLAVATDAEGRLYAAHGAVVGRWDRTGWRAIAELPHPLGPSDASGLAVDGAGRLVVAYADGGSVLRFDVASGRSEFLGVGLGAPAYPVVDAQSGVTVVDAQGRRVLPLAERTIACRN